MKFQLKKKRERYNINRRDKRWRSNWISHYPGLKGRIFHQFYQLIRPLQTELVVWLPLGHKIESLTNVLRSKFFSTAHVRPVVKKAVVSTSFIFPNFKRARISIRFYDRAFAPFHIRAINNEERPLLADENRNNGRGRKGKGSDCSGWSPRLLEFHDEYKKIYPFSPLILDLSKPPLFDQTFSKITRFFLSPREYIIKILVTRGLKISSPLFSYDLILRDKFLENKIQSNLIAQRN